MFITITRTGLRRIGVGLSAFAVLTAVFILFPRENTEPTAAEQAVPASVSDWGLSFQTEGQPPVGNVSAEELRQYNAFYVGDTSKKTIYLTFDAGYENGCTPAILDALKKHNAPACFFVVGNFIDTAPDLVKRMAAEGHIVGNHTLHHPDMSGIADKSAFAAELEQGDLRVTGWDEEGEIRAVELVTHPFFVATLFQHERHALDGRPAPLVQAFLRAAAQ